MMILILKAYIFFYKKEAGANRMPGGLRAKGPRYPAKIPVFLIGDILAPRAAKIANSTDFEQAHCAKKHSEKKIFEKNSTHSFHPGVRGKE